MCNTIGCLFWTRQCKMSKRSFLHPHRIPTPTGKCHQLLILIPAVYVVPRTQTLGQSVLSHYSNWTRFFLAISKQTLPSVGYGLPSIAHSLKEKVTITSTIPQLAFSDSYHRVNLLCDGSISCFSTMSQVSVASNEKFTYKQAMQERIIANLLKP